MEERGNLERRCKREFCRKALFIARKFLGYLTEERTQLFIGSHGTS